MLKFIKKHWVLSIFLLVGGVPTGLNYSGFCWAEKRWLSDEEMIRGAVRELLFWRGEELHMPPLISDNAKIIRESSIEEFFKKFPDCCKISNGDDTIFLEAVHDSPDGIRIPEIDSKLLGQYRNSVSINYTQNHLDSEKKIKSRKETAFISMQNCGMPVDW